jgi:hypothetical protein
MANKNYKTPKGKLFYNRWIKNFNPYNPESGLIDILTKTLVSSSSYIKPSMRKKKFIDLNLEEASYIGYEAKMGTDDSRLLAKIKYFIELTKDETVSKNDVEEMLSDEEVGLIVKTDTKEVVVNSEGVKKPAVF